MTYRLTVLLAVALTIPAVPFFAQEQGSSAETSRKLSWDEQEKFLKDAKEDSRRPSRNGVTQTLEVTLVAKDGFTHKASFQSIDQFKQLFQPLHGPAQIGFKDTYKYNIAAWLLAQEIGLGDMVPPSVRRKFAGKTGAMTWWVDDVLMEERERREKDLQAPDKEAWQREMALVHMFDQLIQNTDRNQGNLIIDKDWHIWMIDHSRAFRRMEEPESLATLSMIDRSVLEKLRGLTKDRLKKLAGKYLNSGEIEPLLKRRDIIVKHFDEKGESVLFDREERSAE